MYGTWPGKTSAKPSPSFSYLAGTGTRPGHARYGTGRILRVSVSTIAVKIKKRSLQIQTKKDLKESLVTKYPKSGINGLWEERVGGFTWILSSHNPFLTWGILLLGISSSLF